jgi:hypothetical protein
MSPEERRSFATEGYVVLRTAIAPARLAALDQIVSRLIAGALAGKGRIKFADRAQGIPTGKTEHLLELPELGPAFSAWLAAEMTPRMAQVLEGKAHCTGLGILFAGAGKSVKLGWHRDGGGTPAKADEQAALDQDRRRSCSFQAPLRPGDCFHELVPGTHCRPLSALEATARTDPKTPMPGAVAIHLEPGDLLLRHAKILHRGHNPQGVERRTLVGDYWVG